MSNRSLNLSKKDRIRLVHKYVTQRKTDFEIQDSIYQTTGDKVTVRTITRDKLQLKKDATTFFFLLAKDNDEYNHKLKVTIDSMESKMADLNSEYNNASDIFVKLKISEQLLKYEKEIYEYYKFLPMLNSGNNIDNNNPTDSESEPKVETSSIF